MIRVAMGWHDTAQICTNGHVINDTMQRSPELGLKFCKKCGAPTITRCPTCNADIQGDYHVEGVVSIGFDMMVAPTFCHNCGKPYPWTSTRIETAKALADEMTELDESERLLLKASIDDIIADTPRTELGIVRFKKYVAKGGKEVVKGLRDVLVDIVSETVKKSIWGP
jgi:hypothetical protein